jgi:predicted XRE-type DNA-binding protein
MARKTRKQRLKEAGFETTSVQDFLDLSDEEITYIEMKLGLARALKLHRTAKLKMSQHALAELIGSSQSRVAKMEAGDPSVTLDLLVRSMLSTGLKQAEIARALSRTQPV